MISIIVPVYKSKGTLERCVTSIVEQSYDNLEVILVDDGSTDGSSGLCDKLSKLDHRIRVIHKENGGVSSARNTGIENAQGQYILFVDSDDKLEPDCCRECMNLLATHEIDMILFGYYIIKKDSSRAIIPELEGTYSFSAYSDQFESLYEHVLLNAPWNKLFIRALVTNRFDEKYSLGEDLLFNLEYLSKIRNIGIINKPLYTYYDDRDYGLAKIRNDNFIDDCTDRYLKQQQLSKKMFGKDYYSSALARTYLDDCLAFLNHKIGIKPYIDDKTILNDTINNEVLIKELKTAKFASLSRKIMRNLIINKHPKLLYYFYHYKAKIKKN